MLERVRFKCVLCVEGFDCLFDSSARPGTHMARVVSRVRVGAQYVARHVSKVFTATASQGVFDGRVELDTHADTFVAGRNCLLMNFTERVCDVMPYSDDYEPNYGDTNCPGCDGLHCSERTEDHPDLQ